MGWVSDALECLKQGKNAIIRPVGGSMRGRIESGQKVTLAPAVVAELNEGDAVLVRVNRGYLLHLIHHIEEDRVLIGNNLGKINGWTPITEVIGVVVKVED